MLADRRVEEATELLNAKLLDLGKDSRLLDVQRRLAELAAQKEEAENIEKVCQEAIELRAQARFDEAVRVLDACEVRYPYPPASRLRWRKPRKSAKLSGGRRRPTQPWRAHRSWFKRVNSNRRVTFWKT